MNLWPSSCKPQLAINFILSTLIITTIGTSVYISSFYSPFLYDDDHAIVNNPYIQDLNEFQEIVGIEQVHNRSFLLLTYALNLDLGGNQPFGFHLLNSVLHACNGILLFFLCWEFLGKENPEIKNSRVTKILALDVLIRPIGGLNYLNITKNESTYLIISF